ncbi:MAG: MSMEG_0565 family glycosyltransferase [Burkholderiales bacterium]
MKIGLLTHSVNPRGGVVHSIELAHALHDLGHQVTVFAPALPGQQFFRPLRCAASLVPVTHTPPEMVDMIANRITAFESHIESLLKTERFDVLHCHDGMGGNALANLQERGLIDGFVRTVHHLDNFSQPQIMHWQRRSVQQAQQVLCVSRLWQEILARDHGITAHEVNNGVDAQRYSSAPQPADAALAKHLGITQNGPVILSVGGVEPRKNTLRVLQAFIQLRQQMPQLQLVIAGGASLLDHSSYAREFNTVLKATGIGSGPGQPVLLTGPLPDADMPALFRLASVVLMPSLKEGFGLVVLEALCSGRPVVVSRIAPFTGYLQEGDVCWADPHDVASIAVATMRALCTADPARLACSAARLASEFSWPRSAARHARIYQRMERQTSPRPALPATAPLLQETAPCP